MNVNGDYASNPVGLPCGLLGFPLLLIGSLVRMAAGFAKGKSGGHATVAKSRLSSGNPKLPQGKPVGFFGQGNRTGACPWPDYTIISDVNLSPYRGTFTLPYIMVDIESDGRFQATGTFTSLGE